MQQEKYMKRNASKTWKIIIILTVVAGLATAGSIAAVSMYRQSSATSGLSDARRYSVNQVSYSQTIEASGNIEAYQAESYAAPMAGEVENIYVAEGDQVAQGQMLADLNDLSLRYELASIEYDISQAQSNARPRELELLEMKKEMAESEISDTKVSAKFAGLVSDVFVNEGDNVAQGAELLRVIDLSMMKAMVPIDEIDVPLLEEGQRVEFIFDAYPDLRYNGYVAHVPREASVTSNGIAVLEVELILSDPDSAIIPAFTFTAEIYVSDSEDILVVDKSAVFIRDNDGSRGMAMRVDEQTEDPQPVRVEVESYDADRYRVLNGLEAGDELISPQSLMDARGDIGGGFSLPGMGRNMNGGERPVPPQGSGTAPAGRRN